MFRIRIKLLFLSSYEDLMFGEDEEEERPGLKAKKVTISCLSLLLWKSMGGHISQSGMSSRLLIHKSIAIVEFIDW